MSLDVHLYVECDVGQAELHEAELYWANITHNLGKMAEEAEIYDVVWRPDENGVKFAGEIGAKLVPAISRMKADPEHFKQFDAPNGWGTYEQFVPWLERYKDACLEYPKAKVWVSR